MEGKDVDGEKAAMKAYKTASDQSDEVSEADKVSSALMEKVKWLRNCFVRSLVSPVRFVCQSWLLWYTTDKVDGMIQNMEKEIDDVKIGKGFLDRYLYRHTPLVFFVCETKILKLYRFECTQTTQGSSWKGHTCCIVYLNN